MRAIWPITWEPEFCKIRVLQWIINNNMIFYFRLFPGKTKDRCFHKNAKTPFLTHSGPISSIFGQTRFLPWILFLNFFFFFKKKNFMVPFYGWDSTTSRLEPLQGGSLFFTIKFPGIPDLRRVKGWVDLGATQQFWTLDPWIGMHCLNH